MMYRHAATALAVWLAQVACLAADELQWRPAGQSLPAKPAPPAARRVTWRAQSCDACGPPPHAAPLVPRRSGFYSPEVRIARDRPLELREPTPGRRPQLSVTGEYLLWGIKSDVIPSLLTTSGPETLPPMRFPGQLDRPDTVSLFGPGEFDDDFRSGARFRFRLPQVRGHHWGLDGSFFFLSPTQVSEFFTSDQFPVLARPVFAPNFDSEFVELIAAPGFTTGQARILADSFLYGADLNVTCDLGCPAGCDRFQGFAGFRFLDLRENLEFTEFLQALEGAPDPVGTDVEVRDEFETRNQFFGGQVGGHWERDVGRLSLSARGSVALGVTQQLVSIAGSQFRTRPGEQTERLFTGGLLTTPTNIGRFANSEFSVVPEVTLTAGFRVTDGLKVFIGYNFLYWSNVLRVGQQIDRVVDVALVPNPPVGVPPSGIARPGVLFSQSDFWAHGINFGAELRW